VRNHAQNRASVNAPLSWFPSDANAHKGNSLDTELEGRGFEDQVQPRL
jgi:hypothetical protein